MPKNSADMDVLFPILEFYYNKSNWVENSEYIDYIKKYLLENNIDDKEREPQHYTKRMQILSYFGFIEWQDLADSQSERRITNSGRAFYLALKNNNENEIFKIIVDSLKTIDFGRNNFGAPTSDSDVEAPVLCIRAILDLKYISKTEFAYLLWKLQDKGFTYSTVIKEIEDIRNNILKPIELPEDAKKYTDWKPVNFLERINFLVTEGNQTFISKNALDKYKLELRNLKIYNVDKDLSSEVSKHPKEENSVSLEKRQVSHTPPVQKIFYGVPGCGKSYAIDNSDGKSELSKLGITDKEKQTIRVVFHPEYTNSDFVGQVYPKIDSANGGVNYVFKPGPFTRILWKAIHNPHMPYCLIIEEINRGNAAAIFGELFQLLDRSENGWSSYSVDNGEINYYLRSEREYGEAEYGEREHYKDSYSLKYSDQNNNVIEDFNFLWTTGIKLPGNLSILATMNTSDQNVFTLDNAFQRRWDMELVPNVLTNDTQTKLKIGNTEVEWGTFRDRINEEIVNANEGLTSSQDKQLGGWFVKATEIGKISSEDFANKVLKYLWDDAFRMNQDDVFYYKTFDEVKKNFLTSGFSIFKKSSISNLQTKQLDAIDTASEEGQHKA